MARYQGQSNFHNGSPVHRTRKQRKRRGNRREQLKALKARRVFTVEAV